MSTNIFNRISKNIEFLNDYCHAFSHEEAANVLEKAQIIGTDESFSMIEVLSNISVLFPNVMNDLFMKDFQDLSEKEKEILFEPTKVKFIEEYDTFKIRTFSTVFAGASGTKTELPPCRLPKTLFGTDRLYATAAFYVDGDSMPPIESGSYIIAQWLEDKQDFVEGMRYVVVTNTGVLLKRVIKGKNYDSDNIVILRSDNQEHPDLEFRADDEIKELWRPIKYIGGLPN